MNKRIIRWVVVVLIIIFIVMVYFFVQSKIESYSKQNTLVKFATVEDYYNEFLNVDNSDTEYMDDLVYSIYTLGYRDDFINLYNQKIDHCIYEQKDCEVEKIYNPEESIWIYGRENKPTYIMLLQQLEGDVEYVSFNQWGSSYNLFDIGDDSIAVGSTFVFSDIILVYETTNAIDEMNGDDIFEFGYCSNNDVVFAFDDFISYGIINFDKDGTYECEYDMIDTVLLYRIYYMATSIYNYENGDEDQKEMAIDYLTPYYSLDGTYEDEFESNNENQIFRVGGEDILSDFIAEDYMSNGVLDSQRMIEDYSKYEEIYDELEFTINH